MRMTITGDRDVVAMLSRAEDGVLRDVPKVIEVAANKVKKDARARISPHPSWRHLQRSLNYDLRGPFAAEVGYDKGSSGSLGNIAEFGSARHAPHPALIPAAQAETPHMERAFAELLDRLTS